MASSQEEVAEFGLGLCCAEEQRGETPGREDSLSDLGEAELDPGGDFKTAEEKAFGKSATPCLRSTRRRTCLSHISFFYHIVFFISQIRNISLNTCITLILAVT